MSLDTFDVSSLQSFAEKRTAYIDEISKKEKALTTLSQEETNILQRILDSEKKLAKLDGVIEQKQKDSDKFIQELDERQEKLFSTISQLENFVSTIKDSITSIVGAEESIKEAVTACSKEITNIENRIQVISNKVNDIENNISSNLDSIKYSIGKIKTTSEAFEKTQEQHSARINEVYAKLSKKELKVTALEGNYLTNKNK